MYTLVPMQKMLEVTHVVTAFDEVRPARYIFSGEMHDFWEMTYALEGSLVVTAEARVLMLSRGQLLFHRPMEFHSLRTAGDAPARVLVVSFCAQGEVMHRFEGRELLLNIPEEEEYIRIVHTLQRFLQNKEAKDAALGRAALESLLLRLADKPAHPFQRSAGADDRLYEQAMRVLNEHCTEALTLSDVARLCSTSESSLKKAFAACSRTGVMHCFTSIKIRRAAELLAAGESIVQVSDALSFSSPSYFHTVFRREMHCTPGEYVHRTQRG